MTLDQAEAIRPTRERHQHDIIAIPERDRENQIERPARVETYSQIDRYERRQALCRGVDEQAKARNTLLAEAGRRYFEDAYVAGSVPRPKAWVLDRVDNAGSGDFSQRRITAISNRRQALEALGVGLTPIAEWVCVDDLSAESWAMKKGQLASSGITVLRISLTVLAKHYGLLTK